jgi:O-antigen ligase
MINKLICVLALLFGISLPINTKVANVLIFVFCIISIFGFLKNKRKKPPKNLLTLTTIFLFGLIIITLAFSEDIGNSVNHLFRRITYLVLPLVFIYFFKDELKDIKKFSFYGLLIGCIISGTYLTTVNLIRFIDENGTLNTEIFNYYYTYHNYTSPLKIHPTYLGSYYLISLIFTFEIIKQRSIYKHFILGGLSTIFLLITLVFINSRIIIGLCALSIFIYSLILAKNLYHYNKVYLMGLSSLGLITICSFLYLTKDTYLFYRFTDELIWETSAKINSKINDNNGGDSRLARWESIIKVIKNKPILGHGAGNEKKVINQQFLDDNLNFSAANKYDSHNNYLSYGVQFGILGILVLILYLGGNLVFSLKSKNIPYTLLSISLISICLFENYLNNNAGIIFIGFFLNILSIYNLKENGRETKI